MCLPDSCFFKLNIQNYWVHFPPRYFKPIGLCLRAFNGSLLPHRYSKQNIITKVLANVNCPLSNKGPERFKYLAEATEVVDTGLNSLLANSESNSLFTLPLILWYCKKSYLIMSMQLTNVIDKSDIVPRGKVCYPFLVYMLEANLRSTWFIWLASQVCHYKMRISFIFIPILP